MNIRIYAILQFEIADEKYSGPIFQYFPKYTSLYIS